MILIFLTFLNEWNEFYLYSHTNTVEHMFNVVSWWETSKTVSCVKLYVQVLVYRYLYPTSQIEYVYKKTRPSTTFLHNNI